MASQLVRPPQLRLPSQSGDRHAMWLELFYDLVFAVAVSALGSRLSANVSPLLTRSTCRSHSGIRRF